MTLRQFIKQYGSYKNELLDKEVVVECPNGLLVEPTIKLNRKDHYASQFNHPDNIENLVITWEH